VEYTEDAPLLRREPRVVAASSRSHRESSQCCLGGGSRLVIHENRSDPEPIEFAPSFQLREDQEAALRALRDHELGVLVAPPGSGKTVVACALIRTINGPLSSSSIANHWWSNGLSDWQRTWASPQRRSVRSAGAGTRRPVSSTSPWHRVLLDEKISTRYQTLRACRCRRVPPRAGRDVRAMCQTNLCPAVAGTYRYALPARWPPRPHCHVLRTNSSPNARRGGHGE